ncbi:LysR substrate-binding domain-containing protein [Chelatococcus asaccharovorans]|uniref:LysR substrate-binding domain-containing protein n=1 Tax=Chelatococcus asaccharovorans TaxID=28210 RepID=UPI00224C6FF1|nr:LysR substrate-binding domain-containing protein [Chelatococcus asaccharovorans]CAH1652079.1 DNA-binding transcriptional LysR family regulator [Chelatococcus asaccharovorans]CAH1686441.1 DNA-binding transcriptional LysR family regulator [Chelatococcus asaccharovorans]
MIDFNEYYYFAHVVESGGITQASKCLNQPKSKLSKRISELERRLGVRLIQRTSRQFAVTDLGEEVYTHAKKMLAEARAAERVIKARLCDESGTIRVMSSAQIARACLAKVLPHFLQRFPQIQVQLDVLNGPTDLTHRMSDLFLVAHDRELGDSSMIQRRIAVEPSLLVASRPYLAGRPAIAAPAELSAHSLLGLAEPCAKPRWEILHRRTGEQVAVTLDAQLASSDVLALAAAAREGAGIAALPASACAEDIRAGRLVHVLPEWTAGSTTISVLLPSREGVLPGVRALFKHCIEHFPAAMAAAEERYPERLPINANIDASSLEPCCHDL